MTKSRTVPKGLIRDVRKGFRLLENGNIIVDITKDEYGFNRWRNVASHCATALFVFPREKFGDHLSRLIEDLEWKINALRFGFLTVDYPDGKALFVFDWKLHCGQELSLTGQENNEYILNVVPKSSKELRKWAVAYGAVFDLESVIVAPPGGDFQRINCSFEKTQLRGKTEGVVLSSKELNAQSCSQEEMMAALLGLSSADKITLSEEVTENGFGPINYYNSLYVRDQMYDTIQGAVEQIDGLVRFVELDEYSYQGDLFERFFESKILGIRSMSMEEFSRLADEEIFDEDYDEEYEIEEEDEEFEDEEFKDFEK